MRRAVPHMSSSHSRDLNSVRFRSWRDGVSLAERDRREELRSAEQHERILEEIPPLVTFESFGDNSLDLKLRCYIGSMDYRLQTLSELNLFINRELDAAGIVIAFPQRDIHLDTSQPLEVNLHQVKEDSD